MVDFPNNRSWFDFSNWISRTFFDDCIEIIQDKKELSELKIKIEDAIKMYTFLLDLSNSKMDEILKFNKLVAEVILLNKERGAQHFSDPKWFPIYMEKLEKLKNILIQVEQEMS